MKKIFLKECEERKATENERQKATNMLSATSSQGENSFMLSTLHLNNDRFHLKKVEKKRAIYTAYQHFYYLCSVFNG